MLFKFFDLAGSGEINAMEPMAVDVTDNCTVGEVKQKLSSIENSPVFKNTSDFNLLSNGMNLEDSSTLPNLPMIFVTLNVCNKFKPAVEKDERTKEAIDTIARRVFDGLRRSLMDRPKRRKLFTALLSKENFQNISAKIPGLSNQMEIASLLKNPMLFYRMAASYEECLDLVTKYPLLASTVLHVLSQISSDQEIPGADFLKDPVIPFIFGLGLPEEDDGLMDEIMRMRQRRQQQQQQQRRPATFQQPQRAIQPQVGGGNQPQPTGPASAISPQMLSSALSAVLLGLNQQPNQAGTSGANQQATAPQPTQAPGSQPPVSNAQRYATELATLRSMGIEDEAVALNALEIANGNVETALEFIFSSMQ